MLKRVCIHRSIDAVVSELRCGRSRQRRHHPASTATVTKSTGTTTDQQHSDPTSATTTSKSRKSLVPVDTKAKESLKNNNKSTPTAELDNQLLELLREKEIVG